MGRPPINPDVNIQIFDGLRFYEDMQCGYWRTTRQFGNKKLYMHRYVWEFYNGSIPKDCEVHHKDGNRANNDISNLEMMKKSDHQKLHSELMTNEQRERARMHMITKLHPLAKKWHKSEAGREWHKKHVSVSLAQNWEKEYERTCIVCGTKYKTIGSYKDSGMYCSRKCSAKHRRDSGVDDIEKTCPVCGKTFKSNKYYGNKTCSRQCGGKLRSLNKNKVD